MPEFRITDMMKTMAKAKVVGKDPAKVLASPTKPSSQKRGNFVPSKNSYIRTQETRLTLQDRWDLFLRYRKVFALSTLLLTIVTPIYLLSKPYPYFSKGAIVYQEGEQDNPLGGSRIVYFTETVVRMGTSEPVLKRYKTLIIPKLEKLAEENADFIPILTRFQKAAPQQLRGGFWLAPKGQQEHLIEVVNSHPSSPQLCQLRVDTLMDALMDELYARTKADYERNLDDILGKISQNENELKEIDSELKLILDPEEGLKLNQTHVAYNFKLEQLQSTIMRHRSRINEIKSSIEEQVKLIDPRLSSLQQAHWIDDKNSSQLQLQQLKTQLDTDKKRYRKDHPTLLRHEEKIRSLEKALTDSVPEGKIMIIHDLHSGKLNREILKLKRELEKKVGELEFYEDDFQTRKELWKEYSSELTEIEQLQSRSSYLKIAIQGYRKAERGIKSLFNTVDTGYQVLKYASTAQKRHPPSLLKCLLIGIGVGMALGLGFVMLLFQLEQNPRNTLDLRRRYRMPIFGALPEWSNDERLNLKTDTKMAEMYHILKNNIRCSQRPDPEKAILLVSPGQDEGKSLTSFNLALSFHHENEKVLLISADLRTPNSLKHYIHPDHQQTALGIVELLSGETEFSNAVHPSFMEGLDILPTCRKANNATKLLSRNSLQTILEEAGENYDAVILDTPAVLPIVDTTMFAHHATSLILLIKAEKTSYEEISFTLQRFAHVGVKPDGLLLNAVKDMFMERFYGIDTTSEIDAALAESLKSS
jgi:capsular exopolysaccharide synthesis family protein